MSRNASRTHECQPGGGTDKNGLLTQLRDAGQPHLRMFKNVCQGRRSIYFEY